MEVGAHSISLRFKNYEDNFIWMFTRVNRLVYNEERGFSGGIR